MSVLPSPKPDPPCPGRAFLLDSLVLPIPVHCQNSEAGSTALRGAQVGRVTLCARTWRGTLPALAVPLAPAVSGCFSRKTHASLCSGRPLPSLFSSVLSEQGRLGKPASLKAALANTDLPGFWSPRPTCGRRRGVFPRKRDRDVDSASPRGSGRTQGSLGTLLGSHHPCRKMPFSKRRK